MKDYKLNMKIDKFLHQNKAEIVDGYEGSLIDNYLAYNKKFVFYICEQYLNSCASYHQVFIGRRDTDDETFVTRRFYSHKEYRESEEA